MEAIESLKKSFPCREAQIDQLFNFYGQKDEPFPASLYVYGGSSSGKSSIISTLLTTLNIKHAVINLIECYTSKILFETILNKLTDHRIDPNSGNPFAKCDNLMEFVNHTKRIAEMYELNKSVLVIDKAEEFRQMEFNLLPAFLNLQEITDGVSISVVLLSDIVFEKYYYKLTIMMDPLKLYFPQYNKDELLEILAQDFQFACKLLKEKYEHHQHQYNIEMDEEFYRSYLNIFLSFFYRACRDLRELRHMSHKNFILYYEPIVKNELTLRDSMALWKRVSPHFSSSAEVLYLRISNSTNNNNNNNNKPLGKLELPFYAKYLLIAAYLASYNSPKDDKRLFMKYHGRKQKTRKDAQKKSKVSEKLNTQIGPKAFTLDRLLAIFYSILDDKVGFNNHLLAQVSTLVELQLLTMISDDSHLEGRKYKCMVNFEDIQSVSKIVGFNIRKHLSDFSHI